MMSEGVDVIFVSTASFTILSLDAPTSCLSFFSGQQDIFGFHPRYFIGPLYPKLSLPDIC